MIESLKGAATLKELAALAQNLEKKLGLPVSVEVLQKLADTKDGYKYLANIDGKLTEMLSKKELDTGVKYWADGVKNQNTNILTLENILQKPQILQSEIFKSETLIKALGFEKLVEVVKAELAKPMLQTATANTSETKTTAQPTTAQIAKPEEPKAQATPLQPQTAKEEPRANTLSPNVIRLAAADTELTKQTASATVAAKAEETKREVQKESAAKIEPQKVEEKSTEKPAQAQKTETPSVKETLLKEIKTALSAQVATQKEVQKEEPKSVKTTQDESTPKSEAQKETQTVRRASEKLSGETLRDKLIEFKHIMASIPSVPSKAELEKIKTDAQNLVSQTQKEGKIMTAEAISEAAKTEGALLAILSQNFEILPQSALQEAAKKIIDSLFGKLPQGDSDEAILKILEHLEKQLEQKEAKETEAGKKALHQNSQAKDGEEAATKGDGIETNPKDGSSKTDNPASKLKAQLLEELAKTSSKQEFQILSNVAMALNKEVFTFVLEDKGILQFKKKSAKELNAKTVEFYSAFETLGPVSGEIAYIDGHTSLSLNVEFESTYNFLKENLKELSFFDHKNVSIMHGIKEIAEIKSSFLDTTG